MTTSDVAGPAGEADRRCRLAPDARLLIHDGQARLIDLRRGWFYALDAVGTRMLTRALEAGPAEAAAALAAEHGVPAGRVRADWERLSRDLRRTGLLAADRRASPRPPGRLWLSCLLALAWVSVRLLGWAGTVRLWRRGRPAAAPAADSGPIVESVGRLVRDASAAHLLNTECKERALVAWRVLRRRFGLPAVLVLGATPFPFRAHAWVECGPHVVTDDRTHCETYTPVARYS